MNYRREVKDKPNQDHRILATKINWSVLLVISDTSALLEALEASTSHHNNQSLTSSKAWKIEIPKDMMESWGIGLETAKNTIRAKTQLCVKGAEPKLNMRFNNKDWMLQ